MLPRASPHLFSIRDGLLILFLRDSDGKEGRQARFSCTRLQLLEQLHLISSANHVLLLDIIITQGISYTLWFGWRGPGTLASSPAAQRK